MMKILKLCFFSTIYILLGITIILLFAKQINLHNADLGRHIVNGQLFVDSFTLLKTNYYSYTRPNFDVVNHHWGSGVIFYISWLIGGFEGTSILFILLNFMTIFSLFFVIRTEKNYFWSILIITISLPLLRYRVEVRPEAISYFFLAITYLLLNLNSKSTKFTHLLWAIPVLQLIWVNMHIFFIFGLFLSIMFYFDALFIQKNSVKSKKLFLVVISSILLSTINPYGIVGVIEPFLILKEYGYQIAENQTLIFMQNRFGHLTYLIFEFHTLLIIALFIYLVLIRKKFQLLTKFSILIIFNILAWFMVRNITLFAIVSIATLPEILDQLKLQENIKKITKQIILLFSILTLVIINTIPNQTFSTISQNTGIGLMPKSLNASKFMNKLNIKGPIFNNYDSGGYLIFHFHDKFKVFVDNRPEAYPVAFFKDVYIKAQENKTEWIKQNRRFNFETIFFYRHDLTPWGQSFLINKVKDPEWASVYVDPYSIIFLKRNRRNQEIIKKFELPKSIFKTRQHRSF